MCWSRICSVGGYQVYYGANYDAKLLGGMAIVIANHIAQSVGYETI